MAGAGVYNTIKTIILVEDKVKDILASIKTVKTGLDELTVRVAKLELMEEMVPKKDMQAEISRLQAEIASLKGIMSGTMAGATWANSTQPVLTTPGPSNGLQRLADN